MLRAISSFTVLEDGASKKQSLLKELVTFRFFNQTPSLEDLTAIESQSKVHLNSYKDSLVQLKEAANEHISDKRDEISGLSAAISEAQKSIEVANRFILVSIADLSKL